MLIFYNFMFLAFVYLNTMRHLPQAKKLNKYSKVIEDLIQRNTIYHTIL